MKKIIFIVGNYKNGGVPMHATNLANELGKRGYEVIILVTKKIGETIFFELEKNVQLIVLNDFIKKNNSNIDMIEESLYQEKLIKRYKRIRYITKIIKCWDKVYEQKIRNIRKSLYLRCFFSVHRNSILIPFGISYYEQTYYASKNLGCKIIYAERNAPELEFPKEKKDASNMLKIIAKADGAVFQTRDEKEFYSQKIMKNVAVIHNPIKQNLPVPYVGERRKVIVNYCRIALQKNLLLLINSFMRLHKEYPEYILEIYGNTVEKEEEILCEQLKEYVLSEKMKEYIHILPPISDVHQKVKDCAMFVSSSDFEGLSNSMIEAMAIGLPCVCTDCLGGGAREMIVNDKNGILVPMKDEEALYQGMKKMIDNPELAKRYGEEASKIKYDMSVEKIVDKWLEVIEHTEG